MKFIKGLRELFLWVLFTTKRKMAKKGYKEYQKYKKSVQKKTVIEEEKLDFKQLAEEYSKLLNKKYCFVLSNGKHIEFQMKPENFYHLLGFNRFSDSAFHKMIEDVTVDFWKKTFYEAVLNGDITYEGYDVSKIVIPDSIKNTSCLSYKEHKETSKVKELKYRRFPYFSYDKVIHLLKNEFVIDFEADESDSQISADKIIFEYIEVTQKNLNLFIGYDEKDGFYPATFFLENKKNDFKFKKDGTPMNILNVLCLHIEDLNNNKSIEFVINWEQLETYIEEVECVTAYKCLKKYYTAKELNASFLEKELLKIKKMFSEISEELETKKIAIELQKLIISYHVSDDSKREEIMLTLFDYDIDPFEISYEIAEKRNKELLAEQKFIQEKYNRLKTKIQRIEEALPVIRDIDYYKVKKAYCHFIDGSEHWQNRFWAFLIEEKLCFENSIVPSEVKRIYMEWMQSQNNKLK